jgi:hypothetical protein
MTERVGNSHRQVADGLAELPDPDEPAQKDALHTSNGCWPTPRFIEPARRAAQPG